MLMFQHMMQHPDPLVAPVLRCEKLSSETYSYDLPLMAKLTYSERRLIEYASDLDKGYPSLWKKQKKLHLPGRYKHQKLMWFLRKVIMQDLYRDLHCGNVMRDRYGNYKLLDLEGFDPKKYLSYHNI